MLMGVAILANH